MKNSLRWQDEPLFLALLATAVDGVVVIDADATIQVCNEICQRMFGYRSDEMVGQSVKMLRQPPYDGGHEIGGRGREIVGRRKDGSTFPTHLTIGQGVVDGEPVFIGRIRDLTLEKQETARREAANHLLGQIVESSDDAILTKTLGGIITSWNTAACQIFGYTAQEAVGQPIAILIPPDRLAEEDMIIQRLKAGESIQHYETARRHKSGAEILVSLSVSPVRDAEGRIVGASKIARDITEKRRSEAHLRVVQAELAHVARLSAMGQMNAAIAHELNQPLTAIMNYVKAAQRLLEAEGLTPQKMAVAREAMEKASAQTIRAGSIIRHLREFVEKRDSERHREDLNAVVEEAVALGFINADGNVEVILALSPAALPVLIDRIQTQQVLLNLIRNAIEAMAGSAKRAITLSTGRDEDGFAWVAVRDTGPGLPAEIIAKLFQPFMTTKEKGMGIGLNICQSIVESHGGHIELLRDGKESACFRIRLPLIGAETP